MSSITLPRSSSCGTCGSGKPFRPPATTKNITGEINFWTPDSNFYLIQIQTELSRVKHFLLIIVLTDFRPINILGNTAKMNKR